MKPTRGFWRQFVAVAMGLWLAGAVNRADAVEEAWRFLNGLRESGYHDMALAYLAQLRGSPNCPEDLAETIDFEKGITLMGGAAEAGSAREEHLLDAQSAFQAFLKDHPGHELAAEANTLLANVTVEQGSLKMDLAALPSKSDDDKKQLKADARELFEEAKKVYTAAERRIYERAKSFQGKTLNAKQAEARDEARLAYLQARLRLASVAYKIGSSHEPGSEQFKKQLTSAAASYKEMYTSYPKYTGGLFARLEEGRMYKELGESEKAIKTIKHLRALLEGQPGARPLSNQALRVLLETYLLPGAKEKNQKFAEAITEVTNWGEIARPDEESSAQGLAIHMLSGRVGIAYAGILKKDDPLHKESLRFARQHLSFVNRFRGEHQREARNLLAELGGEAASGEPETFLEAKERGDLPWTTLVIASGNLRQASTKDELKKLEAEMDLAGADALQFYRLALSLKENDTSAREMNVLRSRLTFLHWLRKDYYQAAVLGEFLARRYPQADGARQGGEIAAKAFRTLFLLSPDRKEDRDFEVRHLESVAQYVGQRWAGQKEGDEAWMMLLDTAVDTRELEPAREYLEKIPVESPRRASGELRLGQALWASYVRESKKPEDERLEQEQLDALSNQAQQTLIQGIERQRKAVDEGGTADYPLLSSVLSLAQIQIGAGKSAEAVAWIDDAKIGPMTLVKAGHPAASAQAFGIEIYKAALRAYVGAQELEKAEEAMDSLEALVAAGGDAGASGKLTQIYIMLGRELEETLTRLRQEEKNEEAANVAEGFEVFLKRISGRETGNTFSSLNWVAQTFFSLGAGLDPEGQETPEKAKEYYKSAANTYLTILERIKADKSGEFAPSGAMTNIYMRLAVCLRALDEHAKAMKLLVNILRQKERHVSVQKEAARTYQDWAKMKGKSGYYSFAIKGGNQENGRYLVWGWGGIARRVAPFEKYQSTFHEARYNLALCRLSLAQRQQGSEKAKTLNMAERDIKSTHLLYPNMGGQEWYPKYDALLKTIQKLRGDSRPTGLKGLADRSK